MQMVRLMGVVAKANPKEGGLPAGRNGEKRRGNRKDHIKDEHGQSGPFLIKSTEAVPSQQPRSIFKVKKAPKIQSPGEDGDIFPEPTHVSRGVRDRLAQDDAEISALEKRLGIKGQKKLLKAFGDDGLDELLEGLDGDGDLNGSGGSAKRKRTEEEAWFEGKRKKARAALAREDPEEDASSSEDLEDEEDGLTEDAGATEDDSDDFAGLDSDTPPPSPEIRQRENPYVAPPTSAHPASSEAYIPPALRASSSTDTEALGRLRRQLQGLLNRLSEANLVSILNEAEQIFRTNPRQHVVSTLIDLLLGLICNRAILQDTFLILHAGFIAAVYKIIGMEFGATMVQRAVLDFDRFYSELLGESEQASARKETTNLMSLLAELYNFQVVGSNLMFDYLRLLLGTVSEINTELLLKIIKNSGQQLRQDDPLALKDTIVMLQAAIAKTGDANLSVRTKFMVETITNLKNNRMKTGAAASALTSESTVRMKKILGSLNTRTIRASEPLRVGLRDIRDTEKKGKWWLVGSSWKDEGDEKTNEDADGIGAIVNKPGGDATADLLQLAKDQRMNTDIRRAIFITIISASDYKDAHLRLTKLRLKRAQELEIPRVLLHCAGAEQSYNPYYTLIARLLCADHKLLMAFQFGLWDLFKSMGEGGEDDDVDDDMDDEDEDRGVSMRKMVNLSKMFGTLIAEGRLGLHVLKNLNLAYLQPKTRTFTELLLINVILQSQSPTGAGDGNNNRDEKAVRDVASSVKENAQLARGLQYFLKKVVSRTDVAGSEVERDTVRWGCKVAVDALRDITASGVAED
ncbi:MAG: suppressor of glycerol defect [Thelocarpon impressellum]|nr:MAG: suppressor of glycerol defect [Thelocarpon impressellum]